tara:strand:+ start:22 stop:558 length:537 start_codon:yes stop_codon:yes gene_type:complete
LEGLKAMNRQEKTQAVTNLNNVFNNANLIVVTHYSGLTVAEASELRRQMKDSGASFQVAKNSLAKLALKGTQYSPIEEMFSGPVAVAFSEDPVAAAKVAVNYSKENEKLIIIGGALGSKLLDKNGIKSLAELPSLDEIRGKLIGVLQAPATKVAGVLQAPSSQLARVVGAYSAKENTG